MRAKYVKKLWYQDPSGGAKSSATASPESPKLDTITTTIASIAGSSGALAVPDRARAALKNYNIDGLVCFLFFLPSAARV